MQYKSEHDAIARRYFETRFRNNVFVGQLRTRLGIAGWERKGPEEAARALIAMISQKAG